MSDAHDEPLRKQILPISIEKRASSSHLCYVTPDAGGLTQLPLRRQIRRGQVRSLASFALRVLHANQHFPDKPDTNSKNLGNSAKIPRGADTLPLTNVRGP